MGLQLLHWKEKEFKYLNIYELLCYVVSTYFGFFLASLFVLQLGFLEILAKYTRTLRGFN